MIRFFGTLACIVLMFVSCKSNNTIDNREIELKNQLIGLTGAHNARQLGGYSIGDKRVKEGLLLRSATLSGITEEDSILLCEKYNVPVIEDAAETQCSKYPL